MVTPTPTKPLRLVRYWHETLTSLRVSLFLSQWHQRATSQKCRAASDYAASTADRLAILSASHSRCAQRDRQSHDLHERISCMTSERNGLLSRLAVFNEQRKRALDDAEREHDRTSAQLSSDLDAERAALSAVQCRLENVKQW